MTVDILLGADKSTENEDSAIKVKLLTQMNSTCADLSSFTWQQKNKKACRNYDSSVLDDELLSIAATLESTSDKMVSEDKSSQPQQTNVFNYLAIACCWQNLHCEPRVPQTAFARDVT